MGYQRGTLVLRAPGGQRTGFVIWEQGTRQTNLRCSMDGMHAKEELTLFWMAEGSFALRDAGTLRAEADGTVRKTLSIDGGAAPVAVTLARGDGVLCAYAFAQGMAVAPERLQALLPKEESTTPRQAQAEAHDPPQTPPRVQPRATLWQEALGRGVPWPPPPGVHAVWRGGGWRV